MSELTIEQIAGKHLGKTSDGKTMTRYEAPDKHDVSLLVPIPRELGRKRANVTASFCGFDVWNAYEFSYLNMKGMPVTGVLKLCFDAHSPKMVESKSLKLFTNSFDFERFESKEQVCHCITNALSTALETEVHAHLHTYWSAPKTQAPVFIKPYVNYDHTGVEIDGFKEDASLLQHTNDGYHQIRFNFHTANLRSNCEITNQKDTGNCYICAYGCDIDGNSLLRYVISMRNAQHFHENVTEIIYDRLQKEYSPSSLLVVNLYNRRGGIDINPVRASDYTIVENEMNHYLNTALLHQKTLQQ